MVLMKIEMSLLIGQYVLQLIISRVCVLVTVLEDGFSLRRL